jgi:hypothetical protein
LPLLFPSSHRHGRTIQTKAVDRSTFFCLRTQTFISGLLDLYKPHDARQLSGVSNPASKA